MQDIQVVPGTLFVALAMEVLGIAGGDPQHIHIGPQGQLVLFGKGLQLVMGGWFRLCLLYTSPSPRD